MAVKIRCRRMGANNDPAFRIVAADVRSARDGQCLETLGWYDPKRKGENFKLNLERIEKWRANGAQISDTVRSLVRRAKAAAVEVEPTTTA
ncbi:MAG: 30S ribosomal protein S16 [Kiritimatiellia bacterium]|jgi:small subunit ribosomal protein S16